MITYKLILIENFKSIAMFIDNNMSKSIPFDPANTDYQAFLRWCEAGNTPIPADEGEQQ